MGKEGARETEAGTFAALGRWKNTGATVDLTWCPRGYDICRG